MANRTPRALKRWIGKVTSHGLHQFTGDHEPFYGVNVSIELEDEAGGRVNVLYRDADSAELFGYGMVEMALKARKHNIKLAAGRFRLAGGETDVHTEHCCIRHGCHYGDAYNGRCSVMSETKPQSFACEQCEAELEGAREETEQILRFINSREASRRAIRNARS